MDLNQLKRQRSEKVSEMRSILDTVDTTETKVFSPEQEARYNVLEVEVKNLDTSISRAEKLAEMEARAAIAAPAVIIDRTPDSTGGDDCGFRNFAEFITEARNGNSAKLKEIRAMSVGDQTGIGYVVPERFDGIIRQVSPMEAVVRPRAQIIPTSESAPDAPVHLVALNQDGANGISGGVSVSFVGETAARTNTDAKVKRITLTPYDVGAVAVMSNRLLNNSEQAADWMINQIRNAIIAAEDTAFLTGTGSAMPTGIVANAGTITVTRKTALSITYEDLVGMEAVAIDGVLGGEGYVWIAGKSTLPTLRNLTNGAGQLIWGNAVDGKPNTIMGYPLYLTDKLTSVGTTGDILLVNLQAYAIMDGSPLSIIVDNNTLADTAQTRIVCNFAVDGKPLVTAGIQGADGIARSPFVKLSTKLT